MSMLRLYGRVLGLLGPQASLGIVLAASNVALAAAQLAEPVLFGRIIDALAGAQAAGGAVSWQRLAPLVAAWVGFGLFLIVCARSSRAMPIGWRIAEGRPCCRIISSTCSSYR
jgi:ATP-binding cassette, subfamily B, beta-glucan exporter